MIIGRPDEGAAVLAATDGRPGAEVELLGVRSLLAAFGNRLDDAVRWAERVLADPSASPPAQSYAAWALTIPSALRGWDDRLSVVTEHGAGSMLRAPETSLLRVNLAWWEITGLGLLGRVERVRQAIDRLDESMSGRFINYFKPNFDGWHALLAGRISDATALLSEFRPYFPGHGGGWTSIFESRLAMALGMAGDAEGARDAMARADAARHPAVTILEPQFALARAWSSAAEGATSAAIRHAQRAAALAVESDQFAVEVLARHTAVRFGGPAQRVPLAQLARKVPGPYASAAAEHAAAWTSGDVSALLAVADRFAAAGLMLCAAEAAAQAELLARRRLDPVATARASARTAELLASCDGAWTPALAAAALPPGISERQHEIAELVAAGLSNREVADRLHLSIRTVEGHIYQACVKLGVSNRAELAALLRRRGR
jgi:DNA-binding CsgD family transcriptional regulator